MCSVHCCWMQLYFTSQSHLLGSWICHILDRRIIITSTITLWLNISFPPFLVLSSVLVLWWFVCIFTAYPCFLLLSGVTVCGFCGYPKVICKWPVGHIAQKSLGFSSSSETSIYWVGTCIAAYVATAAYFNGYTAKDAQPMNFKKKGDSRNQERHSRQPLCLQEQPRRVSSSRFAPPE